MAIQLFFKFFSFFIVCLFVCLNECLKKWTWNSRLEKLKMPMMPRQLRDFKWRVWNCSKTNPIKFILFKCIFSLFENAIQKWQRQNRAALRTMHLESSNHSVHVQPANFIHLFKVKTMSKSTESNGVVGGKKEREYEMRVTTSVMHFNFFRSNKIECFFFFYNDNNLFFKWKSKADPFWEKKETVDGGKIFESEKMFQLNFLTLKKNMIDCLSAGLNSDKSNHFSY